jgi:hypothetical protein
MISETTAIVVTGTARTFAWTHPEIRLVDRRREDTTPATTPDDNMMGSSP